MLSNIPIESLSLLLNFDRFKCQLLSQVLYIERCHHFTVKYQRQEIELYGMNVSFPYDKRNQLSCVLENINMGS